MEFGTIIDLLAALLIVASFAGLFYSYYTYPQVKKTMDRLLPFVPPILALFAAHAKDTKGEFDFHDTWVVLSRVSQNIQDTVQDPANTNFEDVKDEVFEIVSTELKRYRDAGVKGVPDVNDNLVQVQIQIVFEQIQRVLNEDRTRDNH